MKTLLKFRMLWLITRNIFKGYIGFYHGLREIKWCLRAIIGLDPRPLTYNLKGKLTGRREGVEPRSKGNPNHDEPYSIWFRLFGTPPKYEHKAGPNLAMPLNKLYEYKKFSKKELAALQGNKK